jgi:hypothetical protein
LTLVLAVTLPDPVGTDQSVAAAYDFLYSMMDRNGSGQTPRLPPSYAGGTLEAQGFTASATYDDALMIDAFLARGTPEDLTRAQVIGDTLRLAQQRDPAGDGRLRASYESGVVPPSGPVPAVHAASDVGAMAWAGRAMLQLYERTPDPSYLDGAVELGGWIQSHANDTRGTGGYTGGLDGDGQPLRWKSTEQNIDLVSFFTALAGATNDPVWTDRARHAYDFVVSMYDEAQHNFATGTDLDGVTVNRTFIPADAQTWSYLVLRDPHFAGSLDYAATAMAATDGPFQGISATADQRDTVWFEGTSQLALAQRLRGGPDDAARAQRALDTVDLAQRTAPNHDGRGIVAASRDTPPNAQGVRLYASLHTGTTSWYVLAAQDRDPFTSLLHPR